MNITENDDQNAPTYPWCGWPAWDDDPLADFKKWLQSLTTADFREVYEEVRADWNSGPHNMAHDAEERMEACRAEEKAREAADPYYWNSGRE